MSKASKEGWFKYKVFLNAYSKANPGLKRATQIENAQELWNGVKDDPERKKQMMVEFRAKEASNNSKLLGFWGRAATQAAANPPSAASSAQTPASTSGQNQPIPVPDVQIPCTSSAGKFLSLDMYNYFIQGPL